MRRLAGLREEMCAVLEMRRELLMLYEMLRGHVMQVDLRWLHGVGHHNRQRCIVCCVCIKVLLVRRAAVAAVSTIRVRSMWRVAVGVRIFHRLAQHLSHR